MKRALGRGGASAWHGQCGSPTVIAPQQRNTSSRSLRSTLASTLLLSITPPRQGKSRAPQSSCDGSVGSHRGRAISRCVAAAAGHPSSFAVNKLIVCIAADIRSSRHHQVRLPSRGSNGASVQRAAVASLQSAAAQGRRETHCGSVPRHLAVPASAASRPLSHEV
jgi:hypothetical protein